MWNFSEQWFPGADNLDWQVCCDASLAQHYLSVILISLHIQSRRSFSFLHNIILREVIFHNRAC